MEEIRALGHRPRRTKGHEDEFALYERFWHAKRNSQLSESQLAELAELPACCRSDTAERMVTLVEEIRALGHIPRDGSGLAQRLRKAQQQSLLSESQLAELAELSGCESREVRTAARLDTLMAEIRALGHIPRWRPGLRDEYLLAARLRNAKSSSLLSESQLAELAQLARSSDEPLRKRLRVLDD